MIQIQLWANQMKYVLAIKMCDMNLFWFCKFHSFQDMAYFNLIYYFWQWLIFMLEWWNGIIIFSYILIKLAHHFTLIGLFCSVISWFTSPFTMIPSALWTLISLFLFVEIELLEVIHVMSFMWYWMKESIALQKSCCLNLSWQSKIL